MHESNVTGSTANHIAKGPSTTGRIVAAPPLVSSAINTLFRKKEITDLNASFEAVHRGARRLRIQLCVWVPLSMPVLNGLSSIERSDRQTVNERQLRQLSPWRIRASGYVIKLCSLRFLLFNSELIIDLSERPIIIVEFDSESARFAPRCTAAFDLH